MHSSMSLSDAYVQSWLWEDLLLQAYPIVPWGIVPQKRALFAFQFYVGEPYWQTHWIVNAPPLEIS